MDWEALFTHKGDYESQKDRFGPAPDLNSPEDGWYWYGQDGFSGPELPPGDGCEDKPAASQRPADVFYIHPTSYAGALWNMPLDDVQYQHATDWYLATEVSAFNGCCRIFAPRFRQSVLTGMGYPEEGKLATELAYTDVRRAFEYYLAHENNGRPFFLASHSQGSLYSIRLMLDLIEGKPLFSQFVACYGLAAWAPLSLFEGPTAVFSQIQLCRSATAVGCFISWTCEHPQTVQAHCANKESEAAGDWYPQMGHRVAHNEWRLAHREPIVCTDPLTWVSNGVAAVGQPEEWLGMLNVLDGGAVANDGVVPPDMDTVSALLYTPNATIILERIVRITPDEFNTSFEGGMSKFGSAIDQTSGDLQLVPLPAELGGSTIESYEHMNFLVFWFNIRKNVAHRTKAFAAQLVTSE